MTGFELAASMTVDKRFLHYATNSPCDLYVHITYLMYFSKITLLLVNTIANTECQHIRCRTLRVVVFAVSPKSGRSHCLHLRTSIGQKVKS